MCIGRPHKYFITLLALLLSTSTSFAETCSSKSVRFVGRMDYAAQTNGRVAFKTDYIELKDQWKLNSNDFRKLFLAFDIKIYPEVKKALFTSEFVQNKKIIATKKAALLAPIKGAYHEIENTSFQTDLLKNTKTNSGQLKIMFSYDGKIVCEQIIQIL